MRGLALLLAATLGGCGAAPVGTEQPAVVVNADDDSRRELRQVIATALDVSEVTIAGDALTASSELSIARTPPRGLEAPPATGRQTGRPEVFRLLKDGPQCLLVHRRTGLRWLLVDTECAPL